MVQSPSPLRHIGRIPAANHDCLHVVNSVVEEVLSIPHCFTMPGSRCGVKNCPSTSHDSYGNHRNNGIQFFRLPKWTQHQGEQVSDLTRRRRIAWLAAIRRKDLTFDLTPQSMRVCSLHFHSGKPSYGMLENHPDWAPSLRLGHNDVKETDVARYQRQVKRRTQRLEGPPAQDYQQPLSPAHDYQQPLSPAHDYQQPLSPAHDYQQPLSPAQDYLQPLSPAQDHQQPPSPAQDKECCLCIFRQEVINSLLEENRELKRQLDEYQMDEKLVVKIT
ncbi:spindle and kinetochore associated complex subunit [Pimephales promelas]|nr:spindle and kinetochore associated complex subunit [Pimephales promelas]